MTQQMADMQQEMERLKAENDALRNGSTTSSIPQDQQNFMVEEYLNSENYLLELVEEFKYGM